MNSKDPLQANNPYPYRVTQGLRKAFTLGQAPSSLAQRFVGYLRHADPSTTPFNALAYPSQNCFIPMRDRIEPRKGSRLLGAPRTADKDWPIIGHKKRFTTAGGDALEVRVTRTNDGTINDIIEVLYPNPTTGLPQWYKISTKIWGLAANTLFDWSSVPPGPHEYYMDSWFDTNLNPSKSLNVPRLIWTNGLPYVFSWVGAIAPIIDVYNIGTSYYLSVSYGTLTYAPFAAGNFVPGETVIGSTSGAAGIVKSDSIVNSVSTLSLIHASGTFVNGEIITGSTSGYAANASAYTPPPTTWASLGFTDPSISGEAPFFNINGNTFSISGGSFNTNSFLYPSSTNPGISAGDVAFSIIRADRTAVPMDVCRQNQNYMYYGYWKSRRYFMSNAFGHDATATITQASSTLDDLIVGGTFTGTGSHTFKILVTSAGSPDQFQWQYDGGAPTTGVAMTGSAQALSNGITVQFPQTTGHSLGDSWTVTVNQEVDSAWINFYYSLPVRLPGEGYIFNLPSNFWAMEPQEDVMYVNTDYGEWGTIQTKLSSNLQSETVAYVPLKHAASSKVIFPYMIGHTSNTLIYVTENKKLDQISRQKFLELPQIGSLSNPVQDDFEELSFLNGSMEYLDKRLWITSPTEGKMLCYDEQQKYWQPPQVIPENGILSIVGNTLISHSSLRNQTFTLFATDDMGDDGKEYEVIAQTSYDAGGDRWDSKVSNTTFVEGYALNDPVMKMDAIMDIEGSSGVRSHVIEPVFSELPDGGPLGQGSNGSHQLGSDGYSPGPHFYEMDGASVPVLMNYRLLAIRLSCTGLIHTYSWLSMGINRVSGNTGNNDIRPPAEISKN